MQRLIYIVRSFPPPSRNNHPHLDDKGDEQGVTNRIIDELIAREHIRYVFIDPSFLKSRDADNPYGVLETIGWPLDALLRNFQAMIPGKKLQDSVDLMVYPLVLADPFSSANSSANGNTGMASRVYTWLRDKAIYREVVAHGRERNLVVVTPCHELHDFYKPTSGFSVVGINLQRHNGSLSYEMHAYNGADISRRLTDLVQEQIKKA